MTNGPGEAVQDSLLILVDMAMRMGDSVGMEIGMIVDMVMVVPVLYIHSASPPKDILDIIP